MSASLRPFRFSAGRPLFMTISFQDGARLARAEDSLFVHDLVAQKIGRAERFARRAPDLDRDLI
jgi:hypothetical protein